MKIRRDYVSNSSSSSYIIALAKEHDFHEFVDEVVRSCSAPDLREIEDPTGDYKKDVDDSNRRNLEYCLNAYELLYLGGVCISSTIEVVPPTDHLYKVWKQTFKDRNERGDLETDASERLISDDENGLTMEFRTFAPAPSVQGDKIRSMLAYIDDDKDWNYIREHLSVEKMNRNIDGLIAYAKEYWNGGSQTSPYHVNLYEITRKTIINTQMLMNAGYDVRFDKGVGLEDIKKRLDGGFRIFGIQMSQSGEGMDDRSIYAFGEWDADFNRYANVEILHSECG